MDSWAVLERRENHVNKWVVADIWFWQFLEPWHGRWYEYEIFIASCTDNIYDLENERWLLGDMIDHVGIYRSRVAEGLSASNVGLVGDTIVADHFKIKRMGIFTIGISNLYDTWVIIVC